MEPCCHVACLRFFVNDAAPSLSYTLSLHDALPIYGELRRGAPLSYTDNGDGTIIDNNTGLVWEKQSQVRSEEHTSELQSLTNLVFRLLLEKKKHEDPFMRPRLGGPAQAAR